MLNLVKNLPLIMIFMFCACKRVADDVPKSDKSVGMDNNTPGGSGDLKVDAICDRNAIFKVNLSYAQTKGSLEIASCSIKANCQGSHLILLADDIGTQSSFPFDSNDRCLKTIAALKQTAPNNVSSAPATSSGDNDANVSVEVVTSCKESGLSVRINYDGDKEMVGIVRGCDIKGSCRGSTLILSRKPDVERLYGTPFSVGSKENCAEALRQALTKQ